MLKSLKVILLILGTTAAGFTAGWLVSSKRLEFTIQYVRSKAPVLVDNTDTGAYDENKEGVSRIPKDDNDLDAKVLRDTLANDSLMTLTDSIVVSQDTLTILSAGTDTLSQQEEKILIKEEKLIESRSVQVSARHKPPQSMADSLLAEDLGIQDNDRKTYLVEFWEHPLNSRGYKMNGSKIVLYGVDPNHKVELTRENRGLILKAGAEKMLLKSTEKFQKFTFVAE